jgi:superoxide dismutase, Fe-Mn family
MRILATFSLILVATATFFLHIRDINLVQAVNNLKKSEEIVVDLYKPKDYSHLKKLENYNSDILKMHFRLYEGYVQNTNYLLAKMKCQLIDKQFPSKSYNKLKTPYNREYTSMKLYESYFENLTQNAKNLNQDNDLYKNIQDQFGSFDDWKKEFICLSDMKKNGVGFAILFLDKQNGRLFHKIVNEVDDNPLSFGTPLLVMDVMEGAYLQGFSSEPSDHQLSFFENVDWEIVQKRYEVAKR